MEKRLRPSEINYCQNSIRNKFRFGDFIGLLLDDLCEGRTSIENILKISVMQKDGKWVSEDNRRLWVFKQMERLGKCTDIPVSETSYIPSFKQTANENNGFGATIVLIGDPGGSWHLK